MALDDPWNPGPAVWSYRDSFDQGLQIAEKQIPAHRKSLLFWQLPYGKRSGQTTSPDSTTRTEMYVKLQPGTFVGKSNNYHNAQTNVNQLAKILKIYACLDMMSRSVIVRKHIDRRWRTRCPAASLSCSGEGVSHEFSGLSDNKDTFARKRFTDPRWWLTFLGALCWPTKRRQKACGTYGFRVLKQVPSRKSRLSVITLTSMALYLLNHANNRANARAILQ